MLRTKCKIIKTKTLSGDLAKTYIFVSKQDEEGEPVIVTYKYILTKTLLHREDCFILCKTYKGCYLYRQRTAVRISTFVEIIKSVKSLNI